jgi:hypothetical protein
MAADPNYSQDQINTKAKCVTISIRVLNVIFYTLVIACFILGECFWQNDPNASFAEYDLILFDSALKLTSGLLLVYSLLKFRRFLKTMR